MSSTADLWWVYMLECRGGRLYTGATNDVRARFLKHLRGKGAMFTRLNPPLRLAAAMPVGTKAQALRLEYSLKQECRAEKLAWAFRWSWQDVDP